MTVPHALTEDHRRRREVDGRLQDLLTGAGVDFSRVSEGAFLVSLPGAARPQTDVWFLVRDPGVLVESFFLRRPEPERAADAYALLLSRNLRTAVVHFALDEIGDVYLTGVLPFPLVDADGVDRALGQVLAHVEEVFAPAVEVAFAASLRAERAYAEKVAGVRGGAASGRGLRPSPGRPAGRPAGGPAPLARRPPGGPARTGRSACRGRAHGGQICPGRQTCLPAARVQQALLPRGADLPVRGPPTAALRPAPARTPAPARRGGRGRVGVVTPVTGHRAGPCQTVRHLTLSCRTTARVP